MSRTVLIVDDDPGVLQVLEAMLQDLGCEVVTAESGPQALDQLSRNGQISILITDINMPGMDGHELAERARNISPELQVLQLSGRERRRDGFPMIRKPFSLDDLALIIATDGRCLLNAHQRESAYSKEISSIGYGQLLRRGWPS